MVFWKTTTVLVFSFNCFFLYIDHIYGWTALYFPYRLGFTEGAEEEDQLRRSVSMEKFFKIILLSLFSPGER